MRVKAVRLVQPQAVRIGPESGEVQAAAGDWVVRYGRDAFGVVRQGHLRRTYAIEPRRRLRNLPWQALAWLYRGYVRGMHALGKRLVRRPAHVERDLGEDAPDDDERARLLGNAYRCRRVARPRRCDAGGAVGRVEFVPRVDEVDRGAQLMLPALLLLLAGLLALARIKEEWIGTRTREHQRFRNLETLSASTSDADVGALDAEVDFVLGNAEAAADDPEAAADGGNQGAGRERQRGVRIDPARRRSCSIAACWRCRCWPRSPASRCRPDGWRRWRSRGAGAGGRGGRHQRFPAAAGPRAAEHAELATTLQALDGDYRRAATPEAKREVAQRIHGVLMADKPAMEPDDATTTRHPVMAAGVTARCPGANPGAGAGLFIAVCLNKPTCPCRRGCRYLDAKVHGSPPARG